MNDLIKRLQTIIEEVGGGQWSDITEAANRLTAMKAAGDGLGPFVEHQLECRMGMRLGRQYCTCGLTAALKQWKDASDV